MLRAMKRSRSTDPVPSSVTGRPDIASKPVAATCARVPTGVRVATGGGGSSADVQVIPARAKADSMSAPIIAARPDRARFSDSAFPAFRRSLFRRFGKGLSRAKQE